MASSPLSLFALGTSAAAKVGCWAPQDLKQDLEPSFFHSSSCLPGWQESSTPERQEAAMSAPWGLGSPSALAASQNLERDCGPD